ncbi:iron chelate uptake ABC transporter family permease subunit [Microbacterium aurum]
MLQATTRNPLADPYLLGLSSGASLGAVLVIVAGASIVLPLAAFVGAILALAFTLLLASASAPPTPSRIVLAGVAASAALSAGTSTVIFWSATGDSYREILGWLMGSLAGSTWHGVAVVGAAFVMVGLPLAMSATVLDAFAFGDRTAMSLGVDVGRARVALLVGSALLTGALVSMSGCIGFIGLLVPHAARMVVGHRHRMLLPVSALGGALLLVLADAVGRTAFEPRELPVGIVTALVGAPAFALLLLRSPRASS